MHYLMMVSETQSMMYQAELLVRSIKRFSKGKPAEFTLILQGYDKGPMSLPIPLVEIYKPRNNYLQKNVEILYTPYYWELGSPCRWFVKPRSETCVFIDVDVIACSDLSPLYELDKDAVHGVKAHKNFLNDKEWSSFGLDVKDREFYFNMGMVIMPSKHMSDIGKKLFEIYLPTQEKLGIHGYYSGQVSLTCIVKEMGLKRNSLHPKFNWYDKIPFQEMLEEPVFLHYFYNRNNEKHEKRAIRESSTDYDYIKYFEDTLWLKGLVL